MKKVYKRKRILSFGIIDKNGTSWAKDCKITGLNKKVKVLYDFKEGDVVGFANNFVRTKTSLYADLTIDCDLLKRESYYSAIGVEVTKPKYDSAKSFDENMEKDIIQAKIHNIGLVEKPSIDNLSLIEKGE